MWTAGYSSCSFNPHVAIPTMPQLRRVRTHLQGTPSTHAYSSSLSASPMSTPPVSHNSSVASVNNPRFFGWLKMAKRGVVMYAMPCELPAGIARSELQRLPNDVASSLPPVPNYGCWQRQTGDLVSFQVSRNPDDSVKLVDVRTVLSSTSVSKTSAMPRCSTAPHPDQSAQGRAGSSSRNRSNNSQALTVTPKVMPPLPVGVERKPKNQPPAGSKVVYVASGPHLGVVWGAAQPSQ